MKITWLLAGISCTERSSSGQEPTHLPRWEEVARRKSSERQVDMVLWAGVAARGAERGCSRSGKRTQFHCLKFRLGSAGELICSHCYSILHMKIPANNQVILITCALSVLRNDRKCQYDSMPSEMNCIQQGLKLCPFVVRCGSGSRGLHTTVPQWHGLLQRASCDLCPE